MIICGVLLIVSRKISRSIILLGIMVLVLILPLAARAEDATAGSRVRNQAWEQVRERVRQQQQTLLSRYREKFGQLKDARKRALVDRLNNRICTLNRNRVTIMNKHLDRMLVITERVEEKVSNLKTQGKEAGKVEEAIQKARTAIDTARSAVNTQAVRECAINISGSDTTVGADIRKAVSQLETEIKAVREKVTLARKAVSQAIIALAKVWGTDVNVSFEEGE
jgi:hypothetical protein